MSEPRPARSRSRVGLWLRLLGPVLLIVLLWQLDLGRVWHVLRQADPLWLLWAGVALIPLIAIKTVRWQVILAGQSIRYGFGPAFLAYMATLFVGSLTPGRVGELLKSLYVQRDCRASFGAALGSVLADRIFDLVAVLLASVLALSGLAAGVLPWVALAGTVVALVLPLVLLLHSGSYEWMAVQARRRAPRLGARIFDEHGWLADLRRALRALRAGTLAWALLLTAVAYAVYFVQAYFVARALDLPIGFWTAALAVSLGGLVTLLPISISGLGTREAAITAYLGAWGIGAEAALSYALLVFATSYLLGGVLGGIAWLIRPIPDSKRLIRQRTEEAGSDANRTSPR